MQLEKFTQILTRLKYGVTSEQSRKALLAYKQISEKIEPIKKEIEKQFRVLLGK
jgi:hypothetical protein